MFNSIAEYFLKKPVNLIQAQEVFIDEDFIM